MSTEKNIRVDLRVSEEDRERMKALASKYECSESYVLRKAVKFLFEAEFKESISKQE